MAMYVYEREERPKGPKYPPGSYMFVYGQYEAKRTAGCPKDPCVAQACNRGGGITPTCSKVLGDLGIYTVFCRSPVYDPFEPFTEFFFAVSFVSPFIYRSSPGKRSNNFVDTAIGREVNQVTIVATS
jgi:hypothetical protein